MSDVDAEPSRTDLRLPALGAAAWAGALVGLVPPASPLAVAATLGAALVTGCLLVRSWGWPTCLAWLLLALAVASSAWLRERAVERSVVAELAELRAATVVDLEINGDPRRVHGAFGDRLVVAARVVAVEHAGRTVAVHSPATLWARPDWADLRLGSMLRARVRLMPSTDGRHAASLTPLGPPVVLQPPSPAWRAAAAVRHGVVRATAPGPEPADALVPALVTGDDAAIPAAVTEEFRTTGLTHLLAVSGTNLTLVVGFFVVAGRWIGVRGRWHYLVVVLGVVGFVLVARTEPSVVRAAAMGLAALVGLAQNGTDRGVRALGLAVVALLVWDPWLASTAGFALSVLATAGILLLAPGWVAALESWLPRWLTQAIAVPLAAQLACTPVVAAISGEVSLVAVLANLVAAPLVAPATIGGLLGGLAVLVWAPAGLVLGAAAAWCAAGIVAVADLGAGLALPAVSWGSGPGALALLTLLAMGAAVLAGPLLARPWPTVVVALTVLAVMVVPLPRPGWPPSGWVLVACDVGQGDALVLNAGSGRAVLIDAGPDPRALRRCLHDLRVEAVPLLVLTHFHADHVDGLDGVDDERVAAVWTSSLADPPEAAAEVARRFGSRALAVTAGSRAVVGGVRLEVIGPRRTGPATEPNDASLVVLAEVAGVRMLLTGDVEPPGQQALRPALRGVEVDVLKVPHHGSRHQELDLLLGLRPRIAVISVGADNDYGHPAPALIAALRGAGVEVLRTDRDGEVAVVRRGGVLKVVR